LQHRAFINPAGQVEVAFVGDLSVEEMEVLAPQVLELTAELAAQGKPVNVIQDVSGVGKFDQKAGMLAFSKLRHLEYRRMAVFGLRPELRSFTDALMWVAGKSHKAKSFSTRKEAEAWLA